MPVSLALVHHANQYLITDGYENREGITDIVGSREPVWGMSGVLALHEQCGIPLNLHLSGTLLEAIAWHCPAFLAELRRYAQSGLVELIGSCYGQNIMRFFDAEYNLEQVNEELALYRELLGVDPAQVKAFWPPERVWDTPRMAPVLRDSRLLNGGYESVVLDDRTLLSPNDRRFPRLAYDEGRCWSPLLYQAHEIENGHGLIALPIATRLRRSIPPKKEEDWRMAQAELEGLLVQAAQSGDDNLLAIYADDMEKVIGVWGPAGPERYAEFLEWIRGNGWVKAVKLSSWVADNRTAGVRKVEPGTFQELAQEFEAGEGYEKWYYAEDWKPYREHFEWAREQVRCAKAAQGDAALLELASKQLLVANWETAWHTPATGAHGDASEHGAPSPWARALTGHCRHAAVTAEAAQWAASPPPELSAVERDIDHDAEPDLIVRTGRLFAMLTPRWGGRVTALYSKFDGAGAMVIGNPCDDWNFQEELNRFMETPRNHPGAFAEVGFENDRYVVDEIRNAGQLIEICLRNVESKSRAQGLRKTYCLRQNDASMTVRYELPKTLAGLSVECGLSPDYLRLLRCGSRGLRPIVEPQRRGFSCGRAGVALSASEEDRVVWEKPAQENFGHGRTVRAASTQRSFQLTLETFDAI